MRPVFVLAFILSLFLCVLPIINKDILAYSSNMDASVVIGQPGFTTNSANQGGTTAANTLSAPRYAMIAEGKLLVIDGGNNRLLIWNKVPTENGTPADVVFGQTNMTGSSGSSGVCTQSSFFPADSAMAYVNGRLFLVDAGHNRVLVFNKIPTQNGMNADYVLGQSSFSVCSVNQGGAAAANTLQATSHVASDGERLAIADSGNQRVLIFNSIPTTTNASANVVVGQSSFSGTGSGTSATAMNGPRSVAFSNGKLIVGERGNFRTTIFNSIPTTNGAAADIVLGQASFSTAVTSPPSNATTVHPFFIGTDASGRLYVSDRNASRYMIWNKIPTTNNTPADIVLGQPDFTQTTANNGGVSARSSNTAKGIFGDDTRIVVADPENNRVLIFNNILSGPQVQITSPSLIENGKLQVKGNVALGERGKYSLREVSVSVNGSGYQQVTKQEAGQANGDTTQLYNFSHDFEPWGNNNGTGEQWRSDNAGMTSALGYTLNVRATSSNIETDTLFFFTPFTLDNTPSGVLPTFTFSVGANQLSRIKENISHFQVKAKRKDQTEWVTWIDTIPVKAVQTTVTAKTTLPAGTYELQVVARDNWGHTTTVTNTQQYISTGVVYKSNKPTAAITSEWFPLQISKITGINTGIISSFNPTIKGAYISSTSSPTFTGVAFSDSTITMQVTDTKTGKVKIYSTIAVDSSWKLTAKLDGTSIVDIWVTDGNGRYNELPPLTVMF